MRACGADHIEPTGTRLAGVDDDVCSTILFPHRVTLTEHKWVILGERRGASVIEMHFDGSGCEPFSIFLTICCARSKERVFNVLR